MISIVNIDSDKSSALGVHVMDLFYYEGLMYSSIYWD